MLGFGVRNCETSPVPNFRFCSVPLHLTAVYCTEKSTYVDEVCLGLLVSRNETRGIVEVSDCLVKIKFQPFIDMKSDYLRNLLKQMVFQMLFLYVVLPSQIIWDAASQETIILFFSVS